MYVDFKKTEWCRFMIPQEIESQISRRLKLGEINSIGQLFGVYDDLGYDSYDHYESLGDTEQSMTIEENQGNPTIELHRSDNWLDDEIIWDNGINIKQLFKRIDIL